GLVGRDRDLGDAGAGAEGLSGDDLLPAGRPADAAQAGDAGDHDADRDHRQARQAVRARRPVVRQHDGGARGGPGADRADVLLSELPGRRGRVGHGHGDHAAGAVRRVLAGVRVHALDERVHRPDARGALSRPRAGGAGRGRRHWTDRRPGGGRHGAPAGEQRPHSDRHDHRRGPRRGRSAVRRRGGVRDAGQSQVLTEDAMRKSLWLALLLVAATTVPVVAQEVEGEGAGPLTVDGGLVIWTLVVFGLLLLVLRRSAWPVLLSAVRERERRLEQQIAEAERNRAEAAALLERHKQLLAAAHAEAQELLNRAKAVAEKERAALLAKAREEYEQLLTRARKDIGEEREKALLE